MVFNTLWARLSSLWPRASTGDEEDSEAQTTTETDDENSEDETLSYAEQFEYGVDERDLPDEDKILRLLVERGGRVNADTALEETGWEESRLEAVIEEMEADDQVSAITVGRKRVICRRGFEPKGYRSHLNE
ncbi:helix-turn-helix transcriptional regulator [Natrarchaeobaculum aegyptiacum]|uniref:DUF7343 domain-containing protein n=1 Tax=Natrarchaeobaculum aegyptiacum TaxID=745377 RepID=A0A2Z2I2M0_9EURY|nr:hypothetical protein [Natrarchaeobaculum aegyptiacum]ARS91178.1 hypothetical protein B1756_16560 [Natrarchaeobaculum aegyptiacum]